MKTLISIFCMLGIYCADAQISRPIALEITVNKTLNLIFPSAILSIDRGSEHILVQKATAQVLKVKADSVFGDTSNLTVITTDGKLYSFLVAFAASPSVLTIDLGAGNNVTSDTLLRAFAHRTRNANKRLHGIRYAAGRVSLTLLGVYTNSHVIAFKLRIDNRSTISYELGTLSALVSGGRTVRRNAYQERDIPILLLDTETTLVREKQQVQLVVLVPKAGLTPTQQLQLHLEEKGSERQLHLSIPSKFILNATLLN